MCGRFASAIKPSAAWLEFLQEWPDELFDRYNVSPGTQIGAFVETKCHAMRWGLVPSWSKDISNRYATFNARIETIESKPAFRTAWRKNQKCLIPALGYYEWQTEAGVKQPYFVRSPEDEPLVFAGLWDVCQIGDGSLESCTIITTESRGKIQPLHPRMPVMLDVESARAWLESTDTEDKAALLDSCITELDAIKVDRRVNNSREEDASLVNPL
jgi:putative SOS response-associated peptidase YedK